MRRCRAVIDDAAEIHDDGHRPVAMKNRCQLPEGLTKDAEDMPFGTIALIGEKANFRLADAVIDFYTKKRIPAP